MMRTFTFGSMVAAALTVAAATTPVQAAAPATAASPEAHAATAPAPEGIQLAQTGVVQRGNFNVQRRGGSGGQIETGVRGRSVYRGPRARAYGSPGSYPVYRPGYRPVRPVYRPGYGGGYYRPYAYRPYYGRVVGGVALGTMIGAGAYYASQRAPAPGLCWYWRDERELEGYWDYCR